tara:strand:- start:56 stop:409 length:354 start_codon:yes stop_codon:yes gene_type:complete
MANLISDQTRQEIQETIDTVRNMPRPTTASKRRVIRGGAPGSALVYIEITASTNISTYTGTIYDNPITRTVVEVDVTVRALQHDAGTIPDSSAGQGLWCIYINDVYHVVNYSMFYGS